MRIILLVFFLGGIVIGSLWGRKFVDRLKDPLWLFALIEMVIAFLAVGGLLALVPVDTNVLRLVFGFSRNIIAAFILVLPTTVCLGLLFPIVSRCFTESEGSVGRSIGRIYSANTIGCIAGSLVCGFLLIPLLGTAKTVLALAGVNLVVGLILLLSDLGRVRLSLRLALSAIMIGCTVLAGVAMGDPVRRIVEGRVQRMFNGDGVIYSHKEDVTATVTAFGSRSDPREKHLWINGVGMTTLVTETKLMAHLPVLLGEDTRTAATSS